MGGRDRVAETSRKRAASRLRKMRGSLAGKPSALEALLKERRRELQKEERRLKRRGG
jgi:hypothetical protein